MTKIIEIRQSIRPAETSTENLAVVREVLFSDSSLSAAVVASLVNAFPESIRRTATSLESNTFCGLNLINCCFDDLDDAWKEQLLDESPEHVINHILFSGSVSWTPRSGWCLSEQRSLLRDRLRRCSHEEVLRFLKSLDPESEAAHHVLDNQQITSIDFYKRLVDETSFSWIHLIRAAAYHQTLTAFIAEMLKDEEASENFLQTLSQLQPSYAVTRYQPKSRVFTEDSFVEWVTRNLEALPYESQLRGWRYFVKPSCSISMKRLLQGAPSSSRAFVNAALSIHPSDFNIEHSRCLSEFTTPTLVEQLLWLNLAAGHELEFMLLAEDTEQLFQEYQLMHEPVNIPRQQKYATYFTLRRSGLSSEVLQKIILTHSSAVTPNNGLRSEVIPALVENGAKLRTLTAYFSNSSLDQRSPDKEFDTVRDYVKYVIMLQEVIDDASLVIQALSSAEVRKSVQLGLPFTEESIRSCLSTENTLSKARL